MQGNENIIPKHEDTICYEAHGNLYLNITNQCSADCVFCLRNTCNGVYGYDLRLLREPSVEEIIKDLKSRDLAVYKEIVFTGFGEPTCRLDTVLHISSWLKQKGKKVRLDTNGHASLMYPGRNVVRELKAAGVDSVSVSLNAESEEKYELLCKPLYKGAYKAVLDFTKTAIEAGMSTRMTVVAQPGIDIGECERIATAMGASFKVR